jgi:hypothetical protein
MWAPVVPAALGDKAIDVVLELAARLDDRACLDAASGAALLYGQLDKVQPGEGWDVAAHRSISLATGSGSIADVGYAALSLSRGGSRYQRLLCTIDSAIADNSEKTAAKLVASPYGWPPHTYDVISGLAGAGAYLLSRQHDLSLILTGLVELCGDSRGVPNWVTFHEDLDANFVLARKFPGSVLICGLAHGIPGPLSLLSLALSVGVGVPGQAEAIAFVARWLCSQRIDDDWGINWPMAVEASGSTVVNGPTQSAWCYGSPGVARALWHAGVALGNGELKSLAIEAMIAVCRRPWSVRSLGLSPGVCHGVAGLLQVTLRFAFDTRLPVFSRAAVEFVERLLGMYEDGFYPVASSGDRLGFLDGEAGVGVVLLAACSEVEPGWDRQLLLS